MEKLSIEIFSLGENDPSQGAMSQYQHLMGQSGSPKLGSQPEAVRLQ